MIFVTKLWTSERSRSSAHRCSKLNRPISLKKYSCTNYIRNSYYIMWLLFTYNRSCKITGKTTTKYFMHCVHPVERRQRLPAWRFFHFTATEVKMYNYCSIIIFSSGQPTVGEWTIGARWIRRFRTSNTCPMNFVFHATVLLSRTNGHSIICKNYKHHNIYNRPAEHSTRFKSHRSERNNIKYKLIFYIFFSNTSRLMGIFYDLCIFTLLYNIIFSLLLPWFMFMWGYTVLFFV